MAAEQIDVSVVVAAHDRAPRLQRLLEALREQTLGRDRFEVVVVDDGSTDATPEVLTSERDRNDLRLRVISRSTAAGPATAREQGWRASRGPFVAFTDDDCVPARGWLEAALRAARQTPDGFVQGVTRPDPAEAAKLGPFSRTVEIDDLHLSFATCNIVYPREVLERIGGFDTTAFHRSPGGEDTDLAWRAIGAGARPVFEPEALVHHAVDYVGALGLLRVANRWTNPMLAFVRHPGARRDFPLGIFWKRTHLWFVAALLALLLPARLLPIRIGLGYPYLQDVWARCRLLGGGPLLAPYYVLHDLVEVWAVARAAIRYRHPML